MGRKAKNTSQKIREMTDAGYRPREIHKKLGGKVTINTVYAVRGQYKRKQAKLNKDWEEFTTAVYKAVDEQPTLALEPTPQTEPVQLSLPFELAIPDKPSLWVRVKRWFGFGQ